MRAIAASISFLVLLAFPTYALAGPALTRSALPSELSEETLECINCHIDDSRIIYQQWGRSKHYGANIGCYECHQAEKGDRDALDHEDFLISVIVSPQDCARCHEKEVEEFANSHHSKAGRILGSLDNILAEVVEGNRGLKTKGFPDGVSAAAVNGCWQCHGSEVKVLTDGSLDPATWPNTGIGRLNPDGSEGSCSACHHRHTFSVAQARRPDNCGKCHMGPDHPQKEIYEESKHGIAYEAFEDEMNLTSSKWVLGEDYDAAPTCATCHMSAAPDLPLTHNVGLRIKWNNRPVFSILSHETDKKWGLASAKITGERRKENMEQVCVVCHAENFVDSFYTQYEALLDLYNEKYARPGAKLYKQATGVLKAIKGDRYAKFAEMIDFTWFELWHHEGRRARHAASMQGPDYTHWHGTYDLAKHFYGKYLPELYEVIESAEQSGNSNAAALAAQLEVTLEEVLHSPNHRWSVGEVDPEEKARREQRQKEFLERYK
jgi:formate-dependent nitrite reductase cytochrome c552 subunit